MPFPDKRRPYTKEAVEKIRGGQMGCYGLFRGNVCIYVGEGDIRQRLLDHLNGDNPCITRQRPTTFAGFVTDHHEEREKELIREYSPVCNKRVG